MTDLLKELREEWKILATIFTMFVILSWVIPMATVYLFTTENGFYDAR
jgi:NhaP-type Na+/H+ or K+/H+ antiporter